MLINVAIVSHMTADAPALVASLSARGATLATAESLTGGQLAALLTSVPGASVCFVGGVVAYATAVKVSVLGVSPATVEEYGAVSAECATAMAVGARQRLGADYALATTGVAGPGQQEGHPPGHVWIACAGPASVETRLLTLEGDRAAVQAASCRGALSVLDGMLRREDSVLG
ncbi:competence/damage-inducible protein cinA [Nocardioides sp. CF8]|nr:competence/damage-inducible protein cinA [Nocardioides sp. CF8]